MPAGRPVKDINPEKVMYLASIFCSHEQIAATLDCSPDTIERNFAADIKRGRDIGRGNILRKQYEVAMSGNVTMLIWLGKQHLGQTDRVELDQSVSGTIALTEVPKADLIKLVQTSMLTKESM